MSDLNSLLDELVVANRILSNEGVVDAYGHVTIRHPDNPERFFMSRSRSPGLVTRDDILEFTLDCDPIDQKGMRMYSERPIHGAVYQARPDVQAVVHNHSYDVIPFSVTNTPIRPMIHTAAGIGMEIPIWDIRTKFGDTNLLVTTMEQGHDLAGALGDNNAALMRGHGCVVAQESLKNVVVTSVYLQINARLQFQAMQLGEVTYITAGEEELYREMHFSPGVLDRVWEYFGTRAGFPGGNE